MTRLQHCFLCFLAGVLVALVILAGLILSAGAQQNEGGERHDPQTFQLSDTPRATPTAQDLGQDFPEVPQANLSDQTPTPRPRPAAQETLEPRAWVPAVFSCRPTARPTRPGPPPTPTDRPTVAP